MKSIYDLTLEQLKEELKAMGQKPFRAKQIYEWIYVKNVYDFHQMTNLSKELQETLSNHFSDALLTIKEKQVARDGTTKYLLELEDGGLIETVLMIQTYGRSLCVTSQLGCNMGCSLCISSQVGCNMGCKFCESGRRKKQRNLTTGEMVEQILLIEDNSGMRISHVVVMGIGEPFDNYDEVMNFIYTVNEPHGLAIGARHLTISTCGLIPGIERFSHEPIQVNLAISLHAPNDEIRNELMPINKRYNMDDLRDAIKTYIERTNRRVTLEYILLKDVNDDIKYARQLAHYLRGLNVYVNLIPYNPVDEHGYKQSLGHTITAFKDELIRLHINCTLRKEHGRDIDGACGQLRAKREKGA